jgi:hypothetical protein
MIEVLQVPSRRLSLGGPAGCWGCAAAPGCSCVLMLVPAPSAVGNCCSSLMAAAAAPVATLCCIDEVLGSGATCGPMAHQLPLLLLLPLLPQPLRAACRSLWQRPA